MSQQLSTRYQMKAFDNFSYSFIKKLSIVFNDIDLHPP
jgi:hypothetical protein